jgi:hypothetical protein
MHSSRIAAENEKLSVARPGLDRSYVERTTSSGILRGRAECGREDRQQSDTLSQDQAPLYAQRQWTTRIAIG